jgi:putative SOS response-associated peptidase YedK
VRKIPYLQRIREKRDGEHRRRNQPKYGGKSSFKTGEIFPTDTVPILTGTSGKIEVSLMKWGFPGLKGNDIIFNARSETIAEKPMFKKAFSNRRCLILEFL